MLISLLNVGVATSALQPTVVMAIVSPQRSERQLNELRRSKPSNHTLPPHHPSIYRFNLIWWSCGMHLDESEFSRS